MKLYKPDENLPGLELLLDPCALVQRIKSWLGSGEFDLTIANLRYKPETSCLASYRVESAEGVTFLHAKAFGKDDWPIRKKKLDERTWIDEELSFAAFQFPQDVDLPGIDKFVSKPDQFLSRIMPGNFDDSLVRCETLAYKPNRRFVVRLDFASNEKRVLKIYDSSTFEAAKFTAAALKNLVPVEIPRRLGRSHRHQAMAFEWISGDPCDLVHQASGELETSMELIIEFLNRLHSSLEAPTGLARARSTHGLESIASDLGAIYPPLAETAKWMGHEIIKNLQSQVELKLIHGDFYDRQLICTVDGIRACDFDDCRVGDPTSDLANLVAHLHYRTAIGDISAGVADQVNELALRYLSLDADAATLKRFSWNQAASIFRLVTHPFRSGAESWVEQTEHLFQYLLNKIKFPNKTTYSLVRTLPNPVEPTLTRGCRTVDEADLENRLRGAILSDPKFRFLNNVFDTSQVTNVFKNHLPELHELVGPYTVDKIVPRRFKPGRRCMIEFELATDSGIRAILGKASAKRLDRKAFASQRNLFNQHGFHYPNHDGVCVPQPIGYIEPWNIWFQEKIEAVSCGDLMNAGQEIPARQIAAAIAKLHASNFTIRRDHSIADELTILKDRLQSMIVNMPFEAERIERILDHCILIGEAIADRPGVPVHRDFYQDQILFAPEETFLIDLDLISLGHPALDVGNFLAHLTEHGVRFNHDPQHWRSAENEIVNHYVEIVSDCGVEEIAAFKALSFARHIYISSSIPKRRQCTSEMIDVAAELTCEFLANSQLTK